MSDRGGERVDELSTFGDGLGFEVLASSLRADLSDTKAFLGALAEKLGGALPASSPRRSQSTE
jgi:hypothetical protein